MTEPLLGELRFQQNGRPLIATLDEHYRWHCDDQSLQDDLNLMSPLEPGAWEVHREVVHTLYRMGERLGAEVVVHEPMTAQPVG